ncbi:hypothetical protein K7I13_02735 [Brucepastera parasyntrophica]|nr:hypothetical protein [Brucepastera parasyntrophica]ULQ60246.1 hypothetical protein K7I13_02735 [Brucepastera parasyntrophica]
MWENIHSWKPLNEDFLLLTQERLRFELKSIQDRTAFAGILAANGIKK